jgi:cytochrome c biogenesis protein CcdA/thiol-disulfide isomerase/thioredoxin
MLLLILAYLGGVLTIVSPCILPVLPFVFARANRSFLRSGLPLLAGMVLTFALVATLAAVGGGWAVRANQAGRWAALLLLAFFGLTLLFPAIADRAMAPLVGWGARLSASAEEGERGERIGSSLLLGVATGLLWAPCAGPILGLILTGAALKGASAGTSLLLLAYGLGAATSLALALLIGGRVFAAMKRSLGAGQWVRRALGAAVLAGVLVVALGWDTAYLARISSGETASLEQGLAARLGMKDRVGSTALAGKGGRIELPVEGQMPPLDGVSEWMNSPPLTREQLRGKVVVVDFWTYSCINCLRSIPYVKAWAERYAKDGLVVIGVHAPEFAFEREPANVRKAIADLGIRYPVALDNDYALWRGFSNQYWPAHYFIDAAGRVRYHHFGEGEYDVSERVIRQLLAEAGRKPGAAAPVAVPSTGAEAAAAMQSVGSPETYVGYARAERFASPGGQPHDRPSDYLAAPLKLNQWSLAGSWTVHAQDATAGAAGGEIAYLFHARDLHLVLGSASGRPVRFQVTIDGRPPGPDSGADVDAAGNGRIDGQRLYQLVRQKGPVRDRTFTIRFLDAGAQAFAFTFG